MFNLNLMFATQLSVIMEAYGTKHYVDVKLLHLSNVQFKIVQVEDAVIL